MANEIDLFRCDGTRKERNALVRAGAASVRRDDENAGTFVLNAQGEVIGHVPNTAWENNGKGEWLYYSSDVADWLGVTKIENRFN